MVLLRLLLIAVLIPAASWAQTKHLVFDLHTLFHLRQSSGIGIIVNGNTKTYIPSYNADKMFRELFMRKDLIVSVISDDPNAPEILRSIAPELDERIRDGLGKIETNKFDLRVFTSDLRRVIFVTDRPENLPEAQKKLVLGPGADDDKRFIRLMYALSRIGIPFTPADIQQKVDAKPEESLRLGQMILEGKHEDLSIILNANGLISGCALYSFFTEKAGRSLTLKECQGKLAFKTEWTPAQDNKVSGCKFILDGKSSALLDPRSCISQNQKAFWKDKIGRDCAYFTDDLNLIDSAPISACGNIHVLKNPNSNKYEQVAHFDGMETLSLEKIFTSKPPTEEDPFRPYFPNQVDKKVGFPKDCQVPELMFHLIREDGQGLMDKCKPETLYSWGPLEKIDTLKAGSSGRTWGELPRLIYLTRQPVATFGYGMYSVRIKLKNTAQWLRSPSHAECPANTVCYNPWNPGLDFTISDASVIESWSYGQAEHYDEIIKDYLWDNETTHQADYDVEGYVNFDSGQKTVQQLLDEDWDGNDFSAETLARNLRILRTLVSESKGEIFFNPSSRLPKTKAEHFKNLKPIYFDEK